MNPLAILKRAYSGNLQTVTVSPGEQATLEAQGIKEPALQRYIVWRRATLVMVLVATLLSAGFAAYDYFNTEDEEDQADLIGELVDTAVEKVETILPQAKEAIEAGRAYAAKKQEEEEANANADADEKAAEKKEEEKKTPGEIVDEVTHLITLCALPLAALIALLLGNRFRLSYRVLVAAFLICFIMPMLIAVCPDSWWGGEDPEAAPGNIFMQFIDELKNMLTNATTVALLLPSVLSLIPGTQKACLRIKTLLPQSMLSGWLIVVASTLYGLFLLVIWVLVDQLTPEPLILGGFFLVTASSFVFPFRASAFTRPYTSDEDFKRMKSVQLVVTALMAGGGVMLLVYILREDFFGRHLVGMSHEKGAVMNPLDLVRFFIETISKSMFVTAVSADLVLRMNLQAWKESRALAGTTAGTFFDGTMAALDERMGAAAA